MFNLISPEGMPYKCHIFCHFMTRFDLLPDDSPLGTVPLLGQSFAKKTLFADKLLKEQSNLGALNWIFWPLILNQID